MKKNSSSIDGFVPRRPGSQLGELNKAKNPEAKVAPVDRTLHTGGNDTTDRVGVPRAGKIMGRDDITASLEDIDTIDPSESDKKSRKRRKKDVPGRKKKSLARRIIFWVAMLIVVAVLGVVGYLAYKTITASNNVFQGSFLDIVQNQPLKEDANGRSNFLVFGTAEDDEGGMHGGPNLTDSIMVASIDQDKKRCLHD
ncbi:hypothetical protein LRY29_02060 [Candidatus Saccharibacteria bacterium]|nr:hypothetical protein [Candidatus Saccharibacteria bacterium]